LAQDVSAFGAPRPALLHSFAQRLPQVALVAPGGFVLGRDGLHTPQIGPLVAQDAATALALLAAAQAALGRPVVLDVPQAAEEFCAGLAAAGGTRQRSFTRMAIGPMPLALTGNNFVLAGPEFG
jgi:hypothetical protein